MPNNINSPSKTAAILCIKVFFHSKANLLIPAYLQKVAEYLFHLTAYEILLALSMPDHLASNPTHAVLTSFSPTVLHPIPIPLALQVLIINALFLMICT
ncbi:hypothetical protein [Neobacillus sp. 19]|uniref:hypothetical protein n=1 Tax=Neobacillus sp. 19 TaxID=3394458 RepID=UPI003BF76228